jgi:membrane-associated phospholipid phosphatase
MNSRGLAIILSALLIPNGLPSQSVGKMLKDDFQNAGKDILGVWGSPFHADGRDWALAAAGFGAFGLTMFADQDVSDWAIRNKNSDFFKALDPLRRGGVLFSGKYVIPPVLGLYIVGIILKNQDFRDAVMGCAAFYGAQQTVRRAAAWTFGRARPDSLPKDPQNWKLGGGWDDWQMRSFPAGHFANALGCATFWNKRFDLGVAEPLLYAVAAGVGVGRLADEAHWLSDTMIGGLLGYAVGAEVARRQLRREGERGGARNSSLQVSPDATGGVSVGMRWTF